jgi:hypothetical protein
MNKRSIWAVIAGLLVIIVVTTLVDIMLHAIGVFPAQVVSGLASSARDTPIAG